MIETSINTSEPTISVSVDAQVPDQIMRDHELSRLDAKDIYVYFQLRGVSEQLTSVACTFWDCVDSEERMHILQIARASVRF